jgi:acyl carrier protein
MRVQQVSICRESGPAPKAPRAGSNLVALSAAKPPTTRRRDRSETSFKTRSSRVPAETHVERSPMDRQQVFDLIRDRLSDILEVEPATIHEGDSFTDDLDADSLALIELAEALEEELGERSVGFRIEDEDLEDIKTVRDAVDYVLARL